MKDNVKKMIQALADKNNVSIVVLDDRVRIKLVPGEPLPYDFSLHMSKLLPAREYEQHNSSDGKAIIIRNRRGKVI